MSVRQDPLCFQFAHPGGLYRRPAVLADASGSQSSASDFSSGWRRVTPMESPFIAADSDEARNATKWAIVGRDQSTCEIGSGQPRLDLVRDDALRLGLPVDELGRLFGARTTRVHADHRDAGWRKLVRELLRQRGLRPRCKSRPIVDYAAGRSPRPNARARRSE
jgi:hypothetical protein